MRTVTLSVLVGFSAVATGVLSHHLMTSGVQNAGTICLAIGALICVCLSAAACISAKKQALGFGMKMIAGVLQFTGAAMFFEALRLPDLSTALKTTSIIAVAGLVLSGLVILTIRKKDENIHPHRSQHR